jgi:hypothetical protein
MEDQATRIARAAEAKLLKPAFDEKKLMSQSAPSLGLGSLRLSGITKGASSKALLSTTVNAPSKALLVETAELAAPSSPKGQKKGKKGKKTGGKKGKKTAPGVGNPLKTLGESKSMVVEEIKLLDLEQTQQEEQGQERPELGAGDGFDLSPSNSLTHRVSIVQETEEDAVEEHLIIDPWLVAFDAIHRECFDEKVSDCTYS